jgi:thiosulfate/3-mercaptopyruvate sulfurtransferase
MYKILLIAAMCIAGTLLTGLDSVLIDSNWLQENMEIPDLLIFHIGQEYKDNHIPGARYLPVYDFIQPEKEGLEDECPDPMMLEHKLKQLGIKNDSQIVLYYETSAEISVTTRMFVTLDYAGMGYNTGILNGGLEKWIAEGKAVRQDYPANIMGDFSIDVNYGMLVTGDTVLQMLEDEYTFVVDARPESQYDGSENAAGFARAGHIMYAVNIPFYEITVDDNDYEIKDATELETLFTASGVEPGCPMITYCGTGMWASNIYFAARVAGYEIYFYDGSFQEWSENENYPVTEPVEYD